ncbi:MAG TPA: sulfite exporter TauE/SafE family protein [Candidatus Thermoplasmatota archaeon]|nr:sulfite exporter TauE/SafE family protein [Candidatus Thermoplasmatota archaeon]
MGALLYSSVGHGGATVYLAILTLAGFAVGKLTTTVLVLNIAAAAIGFAMFGAAGHLRWRLLLPFLATSVPMAYLGGRVPLSGRSQAVILGLALLAGALRLLFLRSLPTVRAPRTGGPFYAIALAMGAALGFLAGATGIGGGIFLSPVLLMLGWASVKEAGNVAAAFIVLNSLAGLAAKLPRTPLDMGLLLPLGAVVVAGAVLGSFAGARKIPPRALQVLLGCVLLAASVKALFGL